MAMHRPIGVKGWRFIGNLDVLDQGWDDLVPPTLIDEFSRPRDVDHPTASACRATACYTMRWRSQQSRRPPLRVDRERRVADPTVDLLDRSTIRSVQAATAAQQGAPNM